MKKIIKFIITLSIVFSSLSNTFAEEGYIETLFDLNYGIEEFNFNLSEIKYISFKSEQYNKTYRNIKRVDSLLKNGFMKKYRDGNIDYYSINGIIKNYNDFIYHTNQFFFFIKLKEQNNNYKETNTAIINSYRNMKNSYNKVKNITRGN